MAKPTKRTDVSHFEQHVISELKGLKEKSRMQVEMLTTCYDEVTRMHHLLKLDTHDRASRARAVYTRLASTEFMGESIWNRPLERGESSASLLFPSEGSNANPRSIRKFIKSFTIPEDRQECDVKSKGGGSLSLRAVAKRVWRFLEDRDSSWASYCYYYLSTFLLCSCVCTALVELEYPGKMDTRVVASLEFLLFLEVVLRFSSCPHSRLLLVNKWFNIIDIVSSIPLIIRAVCFLVGTNYVDMFAPVRIFFPAFLLLKLVRRFDQFQLVSAAFFSAFDALPVMLYTMFLIACVFAASLYLCEPAENIESLGISVWMCLVTMSTVGYGDKYPVTASGRFVSVALIIIGSLYMAIPIGIVGNSFSQIWEDRERLLLFFRIRDRIVRAGHSAEDMMAIFKEADDDGDGVLSLDEFIEMLQSMDIAVPSELARKVYDTFYGASEGMVEFTHLLQEIFPTHTPNLNVHAKPKERKSDLFGSRMSMDSARDAFDAPGATAQPEITDDEFRDGAMIHDHDAPSMPGFVVD
eukprot:TRINITY_DN10814_c0_g1_i1.p1 TRINITY_DN10814_c0_g1~~TRINITY_DN10814_c0_g1_i1.p1  ORF type:complete len:524 (-),score=42.23 TRINITY_DN10814_c0_g1_i1:84-1655(-)